MQGVQGMSRGVKFAAQCYPCFILLKKKKRKEKLKSVNGSRCYDMSALELSN